MNKLAIAIYFLLTLVLAACGNDSGEKITDNAAGSSPGSANAAQSQKAGTTVAAEKPGNSRVPGNAYRGFDMAGIYLGMSPEEVESVIREYAPEMKIKKDLISFNYNAMGTRYKTDSFVNYMGGSTYANKLSLGVRLSYPPGPLKVVALSRGDRHQDSPIPQSVYVESLIEKYGPPALDSGTVGTGAQAQRTLEWPFGNGTVQCFSSGGEAATGPVLDRMVQNGRRYPNPTPEFAQQCISMLRYVLRGEPVIQANGSMIDVAASANAEFENRAWIQSLIDKKSAPGTDKPKL